MLDARLRPVKDRALGPATDRLVGHVSPLHLSLLGALCCVGAGVLAWQSLPIPAVAAWLIGRTLDGVDGSVARSDGSASDFGGYLDLLLDTLGYAAVPLGVAAGVGTTAAWTISAVLLATFYANAVALLLLSSIMEKRGAAEHTGRTTSVALPPALIEGTETIVLLGLALAVPAWSGWIFGGMAVGVGVGIMQRTVAARRLLSTD